ncbi:hypothetical protein [Bradyrhizobium sp. Leo170]|uniref:hypothetical protein n=1 Tax=Bradyrhizobium sp. Leo170 TaxID=1571199 RepID=UPI0013EE4EE8|nr:hypothetical protein [Bradyrhizobium sp. Leo170]
MPDPIIIPPCLEPLANEARWLVWRKEAIGGKKPTKVPYRADWPSKKASSKDPTTWSALKTAMQAYQQGGFDGIAFALLGSNIVAFDLDDCRDSATGILHEWARQLVERCGSYSEVTPSGAGLRILGTGNGAMVHRKFAIANGAACEIYRNCTRFITVTGDQLAPQFNQLKDLDLIADEVLTELDTAKKANKQQQQSPLFRGEDSKASDRSLADLIKNGCGASYGGDKSRAVWRVINGSLDQGKSIDEIIKVLIDPANGISTHLLSRPEDPRAYACRQIEKAMADRAAEGASPDGVGPDADGVEIARLAKLRPADYDRERVGAAKRMGCRAQTLDRLVQAERDRVSGGGDALQGRAVVLSEPKPWDQEVDGVEVADAIAAAIRQYVVLDDHAKHAAACWILHAHLVECFLISPRLSVMSATKGCGKSTMLDAASRLVPRPLLASNVSSSAIFRAVEKFRPTLLCDEADTYWGRQGDDSLRGILNSGHRKGGAVLRTAGDDHEPRMFSTFGALRPRLNRGLAGDFVRPFDSDRAAPPPPQRYQ